MNLQKMMKQAQAMQQKMEEFQQKMAETEFTGSSGGGMVSVTVTGKGEVKKLTLDPKIVDPDDIEMMEDLIVAAINDAKKSADDAAADGMQDMAGGMGLPPGMKLPF